MPSVSTRKFSDAVDATVENREGHAPIRCIGEIPQRIEKPTPTDILKACERILAWARSKGIEGGLEVYQKLPVSARGALLMRHLVALALSRNIGTIDAYRVGFERGERPGFVPYLTLNMIEWALLISRRE